MAQGDITAVELLDIFSTKSNPFWSKDSLPFNGKYFNLNKFKSLNTNKQFQNTVLGAWNPIRDKSSFTFPYQNIFELILHSGTQSGTIGENYFASTGDLLAAGFPNELANKYGYKYTATGTNIGYNEIYIEGTGNTIYDLLGKEVECIMISRFSDSGIVPFNNLSGFKIKNQKCPPGLLRYQFFLTTGSFTSGDGVNQSYSYISVGTKVNTENYLNITGNNTNLIMAHSGISGENLFGTFDISNSGNFRLNYNVLSLDPKIIIDSSSPTGSAVRAGNSNRIPRRKRLFNKKSISYKINTSGLNLDQEYTGYIRVSGIYRPGVTYNITGLNVPVKYKIQDLGARAAFDNFYFRYTGDFHQNLNAFQTYQIGETINLYSGGYPSVGQNGSLNAYNRYPRLTLGLSIYNTGSGVSGALSSDRISSGFLDPINVSNLFWHASASSPYIHILNKEGGVHFRTGISGSLPAEHNIIYSGESGSFQNDIFFSIRNTGQIPTGFFSGDILINTSDITNSLITFPILINFI